MLLILYDRLILSVNSRLVWSYSKTVQLPLNPPPVNMNNNNQNMINNDNNNGFGGQNTDDDKIYYGYSGRSLRN